MTPWPNGLSQVIYPHNLLLNFWVATGVLGVVAFAVLLIQAFRITWRGWRTADAGWRPFELGVLLALVSMVVHGVVDVPYFKNDLSFEFWVLLAIAWAGMAYSHPALPQRGTETQSPQRERQGSSSK
jgi:O-antigen ligase